MSSSSTASVALLAAAAVSALLLLAGPAAGQDVVDAGLTAGADEILDAPYVDTFDCEGRAYGYYADIDNNCQVFHVCLPMPEETEAEPQTLRYSFICGNGTVFDQESLVCNHRGDAFPCEESESLYGAVDFGARLEE